MLMPLAMPAMLPTIDMQPVYDECRVEFTKRKRDLAGILVFTGTARAGLACACNAHGKANEGYTGAELVA